MRRGIPMAGNFLQQENVVLTGACEAIVVDVQCIFPALGPLSKCFHTKFVTTSPIAQMPDSEFIRFDAETAGENAKAIVKMAIDNFKNRKPELVHIPQLKQKATVGYSLEAIVKVLDGVTNSQVDELEQQNRFLSASLPALSAVLLPWLAATTRRSVLTMHTLSL